MSKSDKTVIITGATSGIGLGLAEAFLKEGYNVVGTSRSAERLEATASSASPATSASPSPPRKCSSRPSPSTARSTCW